MQVQYFPQLGYLISLPVRELRRWGRANHGEETTTDTLKHSDDMIEDDPLGALPEIAGLRFAFTSNLEVFWKSREMEEMDEHVRATAYSLWHAHF